MRLFLIPAPEVRADLVGGPLRRQLPRAVDSAGAIGLLVLDDVGPVRQGLVRALIVLHDRSEPFQRTIDVGPWSLSESAVRVMAADGERIGLWRVVECA